MTRINLVSPELLSDKHLMAEYRELPRIFTSVRKLYDSGKTHKDVVIPNRYVMGKGHCKFFYDKLDWLQERYQQIVAELRKRDFDLNDKMIDNINNSVFNLRVNITNKYNEVKYTPTAEEVYLNMARIVKRSGFDRVIEELEVTNG